MLSEKNKDTGKAFDLRQLIRQDEKARMIYEARQAYIRDELTRLKSAEEKGKEEGRKEGMREGINKGKMEIAQNLLLMGMPFIDVVKATDFTEEEVKKIKRAF